MTAVSDEVSFSDYRKACVRLQQVGESLLSADPDEAAEHWLPILTLQLSLIWSFVGVNMTARHTSTFTQTVADLEAAKDRASSPPPEEGAVHHGH